MTVAEDPLFTIFTNLIEAPVFCRSWIVGVVARVIVGVAFCTVSDAEFPFRITIELAID